MSRPGKSGKKVKKSVKKVTPVGIFKGHHLSPRFLKTETFQ